MNTHINSLSQVSSSMKTEDSSTIQTMRLVDVNNNINDKDQTFLEKAQWNVLTPEVYSLYSEYYDKTPQPASEYSFIGAYIWNNFFGLQYTINEELLFLQTNQAKTYWAPLGKWKEIDWSFYNFTKLKPTFHYVPEELTLLWKEYFKNSIRIEEDRDSWDYIYTASDLAELSGRKYAKKKNHLNNFIKTTQDYTVHDITKDNANIIMQEYKEWASKQEQFTPLLQTEYNAICSLLEQWELFPQLQGIYITSEDSVIAFTIGEPTSSNMFIIQVEKALQDTRGLYQCINKEFAMQIVNQGYTYINRGDDYGLPGLRKAKESYNPVDYIKKYTVTFL